MNIAWNHKKTQYRYSKNWTSVLHHVLARSCWKPEGEELPTWYSSGTQCNFFGIHVCHEKSFSGNLQNKLACKWLGLVGLKTLPTWSSSELLQLTGLSPGHEFRKKTQSKCIHLRNSILSFRGWNRFTSPNTVPSGRTPVRYHDWVALPQRVSSYKSNPAPTVKWKQSFANKQN